MVFPIYPSADESSIFERIAQNSEENSDHQISLSHMYKFVHLFAEKWNLSCGTLDEFVQKIFPICQKDLNSESIKAKNAALAHLLIRQKDVPRNLVDGLKSKSLPPFYDVIPHLVKFLRLTGLRVQVQKEWIRFWNEHYQDDMLKMKNFDLFSEVYLSEYNETTLLAFSEIESLTTSRVAQEKWADKQIANYQNQIATTPAAYLESFLSPLYSYSGKNHKILKSLQVFCSCLVAEEQFHAYLTEFLDSAKALFRVSHQTDFSCSEVQSLLWNICLAQISPVTPKYFPIARFNYQFKLKILAFNSSLLTSLQDMTKDHQGYLNTANEKLDDLVAFLDHAKIKMQTPEKRQDVEEIFEAKNLYILFLKNSISFRSFIIKLTFLLKKLDTLHADLKKDLQHDLTGFPSISAFSKFINEKDTTNPNVLQNWVVTSFEKFAVARNTHKTWFEELYQLAFNKLDQTITHTPSERQRLLHYKLNLLDDLNPKILPKPEKYRSCFENSLTPAPLSKPQKTSVNRKPTKAKSTSSKLKQSKHEAIKSNQRARISKEEVPTSLQSTTVRSSLEGPSSSQVSTWQLLEREGATRFPYKYHRRVQRWFSAHCPLSLEEFPNYASSTLTYQRQMIEKHAFSKLADLFWERSLRIPDPKSPNVCLRLLPAELTAQGHQERGYILWGIDNSVCFHRFFHVKSDRDVINAVLYQKFDAIDFPALARNQQNEKSSKQLIRHIEEELGEQVELDELLETATFCNSKRGTQLKLYLEPKA